MRWWLSLFKIVTACALFCCRCAWTQEPVITAFAHVNVVDVRSGHIQRDLCVVVKEGLIASVGKSCGTLAHSRRLIDGKGKYLIPGLWDMHVHSDGDKAALRSMLLAGITVVRDMGGKLQNLVKARQEIRAGVWQAPMLLIAAPMLEGPPGKAEDKTWIIHDAAEADRAVSELAKAHIDFVKVHDYLSREAYFAISQPLRSSTD